MRLTFAGAEANLILFCIWERRSLRPYFLGPFVYKAKLTHPKMQESFARSCETLLLYRAAGIAPNTMTKLRRDEEVTLTVLNKICAALNANIGDIMDFVQEEEKR